MKKSKRLLRRIIIASLCLIMSICTVTSIFPVNADTVITDTYIEANKCQTVNIYLNQKSNKTAKEKASTTAKRNATRKKNKQEEKTKKVVDIMNKCNTVLEKFEEGDTEAAIGQLIKSGITVIAGCFGYGAVAESAFNILDTLNSLIVGSPTEDVAMTEVEKMQDVMLNEFDKVAEQNQFTQEQIAELSNQLSDCTNQIIAQIKSSNDEQTNNERVYKFFGNANASEFNYSSFTNAVSGSANPKENYLYKSAYVMKLETALSNAKYEDDLSSYYQEVYKAFGEDPKTNLDTLYSAYLLENETTNQPSIFRAYYDFLCANEDVIPEGESACSITYNFIDALTEAVYLAEEQYLWSCLYLNNQDVESIYNAQIVSHILLDKQIAKDISYIFNQSESYYVGYYNGYGNYEVREVVNTDSNTYGQVLKGETIYLSQVSSEMCDIFAWELDDYYYVVNGEVSNGIINVDGSVNKYEIKYYYNSKDFDNKVNPCELFSFTINVQSDDETTFCGGSGYSNDPYLIANEKQLSRISNEFGSAYKLINNITITNDFEPIGYDKNHQFEGVFDGNGFSISSLNFNEMDSTYGGLFGYSSGTIKNINMVNTNIDINVSATGNNVSYYLGGFVGYNSGTIINCHIKDSKIKIRQSNSSKNSSPYIAIGGVVGLNNGNISYCSIVNSSIYGESLHEYGNEPDSDNQNSIYSGGLVGINNSNISYLYIDSKSSIKAVVVSRANKSAEAMFYINSYAGEVYAQNNGSVSNVNSNNPTINGCIDNFVTDDGNNKKTYNDGTKEETVLFIFKDVVNAGFSSNYIKRNNVNISKEERNNSISKENLVLNDSHVFNISFDDYLLDCGNNIINPNNLKLTIDGIDQPKVVENSKTKQFNFIGLYGFDSKNNNIENTASKTCDALYSVTLNGKEYLCVQKLDYSINKNYIQNIEFESIDSLLVNDEHDILVNATLKITYADNTTKKLVCANSNFSIDNEEVDCDIFISSNVIGPATLTITYQGIECSSSASVSCDHSYVETCYATTCYHHGYTEYTCKYCGFKYISENGYETVEEHIEKNKSNISIDLETVIEATCHNEGYTGDYVCGECGCVHSYGFVIKKIEHNYDDLDDYTHSCTNEGCNCKEENHQYVVSEILEYVDNKYESYFEYKCIECGHIYKDYTQIPESVNELPQVVVSNSYVLKDSKMAKVYIQLLNNPGFDGAVFSVKYDTRLRYAYYEEGDLWKNSFFSASTDYRAKEDNNGIISFSWTKLNKVTAENGNLLVLYFELPAYMQLEDSFSIDVVYTLKNDTIGGFDNAKINNKTVVFLTRSGTIKVVEHLPGDVNGDNVVDIMDMVSLSNYFLYDKDDSKNIGFLKEYADVNLVDGINTSDLVDLMRYIVGGYGTDLLLPTYNLHLNPTGGSIDNTNITVTNGEQLELEAPTRVGYTFEGWYYSLTGNDRYNGTITYQRNQKVQTLYARWKVNSITIKFSEDDDSPSIAINYQKGKGNTISYENFNDELKEKFVRKYYVLFEAYDKNVTKDPSILEFRLQGFKGDNEVYNLSDEFDLNNNSYVLTAIWDEGTIVIPDYVNRVGYTVQWYTDSDLLLGSLIENNEEYLFADKQVRYIDGKYIDVYNAYYKYIPDVKIEKNNDVYEIVGLNNTNILNLTILKEYDGGKIVTIIKDNAFENCTNLEIVIIQGSITSIGANSFSGCSSLIEITIPNSIASIGNGAFYQCNKLKKVNYLGTIDEWCEISFYHTSSNPVCISKNLYINNVSVKNLEITTATKVSNYAFYGMPLLSVTLGTTVKSIGNYAFYSCTSLTSITLQNSVGEIGAYAFYNCYSLTSITLPNSVEEIGAYAFYYCASLTSIELPNSVTTIGNSAFMYCFSLTNITLPNSLKSIGENMFYCCTSLISITLPNGVEEIGDSAFSSCSSLTNITLPNSVEEIGIFAFAYCESLISITLPNGLKSIGEYAFCSCTSLTSITLPNGVEEIGKAAFSSCTSLTSITLPESNTSIGTGAFNNCTSLTNITIPTGITNTGVGTFQNCTSLISITLPNSVTTIGEYAFTDCTSLTSITFSESIESVGEWAFYNCTSLISITLPNGLKSIGEYAFCSCTSLTNIVLPDSVEEVGDHAFAYCSSISKVNYLGTADKWCGIKFFDMDSNPVSYSHNLYFNNVLAKNIEITTATEIGNYAFAQCSTLESIIIPNTITRIGWRAFYKCSSLTSIEIPDSVYEIGNYAFSDCISLTNIKAGKISNQSVFSGCLSITKITIYRNVNLYAVLSTSYIILSEYNIDNTHCCYLLKFD